MEKEVSNTNSACLQVLNDYADTKPDWKYVKSSKCFVRTISKNAFVDICTGMSAKIAFVNFQFSLHAGHRKISELSGNNAHYDKWAIVRVPERWLDKSLNWGSCTVYDPHNPYMREYDELRAQGNKNYVRLEEFPERLNAIFTLAEVEIDKLFDLSSEEALIRSIIDKPMGTFRPNEVLLIQLLLGNPAYYDELVAFYNQDLEVVRSMTKEPFGRTQAEQLMERYKQGDFPKFDFA